MILIVNPPSVDKSINRDMAGGLGYSAGNGVVLPPLDLLILASTLKKDGNKVIFVDSIAEKIDSLDYFIKLIKNKKIKILIGNLALPTLDEDCSFYSNLRSKFKNLQIVIKTGINYEEILKKAIIKSKADFIIFKECDLEISNYLDKNITDGTIYLKNGKIFIEKSKHDVLDNLDLLPFADRKISKIERYKYVLLPGICTTMQTSRGCPYPCGYYCPYPLVQGTRWRRMSPKKVVNEIEQIIFLGIDSILFRDATFSLDMKRAEEICEEIIARKLKINWWCETRINVLDENLLRKMKNAGCMGINVGVETLDEKLIVSEGKPGVRLEDVVKVRKAAKEIGIRLHFLMIIGLPNDNLESIYRSFEYLVKLRPESIGFTTITPYPGTKMFDDALRDGLIMNMDWNNFNGSQSNMKTKYLSQKDLNILRFLLSGTSFLNRKPLVIRSLGIEIIRGILKIWKGTKKLELVS